MRCLDQSGIFKKGDKVYSKMANPKVRKIYTIAYFRDWGNGKPIQVHFEEMQNHWKGTDMLVHETNSYAIPSKI